MIIPQDMLEETVRRYAERRPMREATINRIETRSLLEVDDPVRVEQRLERLAQLPDLPGAPLDAELASRGIVEQPAPPELLRGVLERVLGRSDLLSVSYLELGLTVARAVGRVLIGSARGQNGGYGTGFLVAPRLLLTNNHVLPTSQHAADSEIEFNYQHTASQFPTSPVVFALDPDALFLTSEKLDYTLVAVTEQARDGSLLRSFGWNRLIEEEGKVLLGEYVSIIQHPNGEPKQLALRENQLIDLLENFLHYRTDTAPGSSGSPIFNDQWEVVGLHHSGVPRLDAQGNMLARDGTLWTEDKGEHQIDWIANEGIRISRIIKHIKRQRLPEAQRRLRSSLFDTPGDERTPAPPIPARPAPQSQPVAQPQLSADGTAVWTIPLEISVRIGTPAPTVAVTPGAPVPQQSAAPRPDQDSPELQADLAESRAARSRPYYDRARDQQAQADYYRDLHRDLAPPQLFQRLHELLTETHTTKLAYQPRKHVYPWLDLHPDGQIRSIYSGQVFSPETLIREDFQIEQRRVLLREQLRAQLPAARTEAALAEAQSQELFSALEASLPYNCEHVVPQSWFGAREPMRGDLHHLFACESGCNSFRGNTAYFDFTDFGEALRSTCGKALKADNQFEPEHGKGVVARATLYFLLRYPGLINATAKEYHPERLAILLRWHARQPVSDYERHRNAICFEKQGNRNPLIDVPDLAERIDFSLGLGR